MSSDEEDKNILNNQEAINEEKTEEDNDRISMQYTSFKEKESNQHDNEKSKIFSKSPQLMNESKF